MLDEELVQAGQAGTAEQAVGAVGVAGPIVLEVEGLDDALYLDTSPGATATFAAAVQAS